MQFVEPTSFPGFCEHSRDDTELFLGKLTNRKLRKSQNGDNNENKDLISSRVASFSPLPLCVRNFSFFKHDVFLIPLEYFSEECVVISISRYY